MPRLLFEKKGSAVWISHLDLMRLFQRAFKRANLPLKHTQGFNPRPSVSIALPMSVGVDSCCELLDFDLDGETLPCEEICHRLNQTLVSGVRVLEGYEAGRKIRELSLLRCKVFLEYDTGIADDEIDAILKLFSHNEVIVPKKTKNGIQEQNIIPMIQNLQIERINEKEVCLEAVVCCQNPTLNPAQLALAIGLYLPEMTPDFFHCSRLEVYDNMNIIFR